MVVVWPPVSLLSIAFSFSSADDAVPFVFVAVDVVIDGISRIKNRNMAIHCTDVNDKSHFSRHLAKTWGEIVKVGVGVDIGGVLLVVISQVRKIFVDGVPQQIFFSRGEVTFLNDEVVLELTPLFSCSDGIEEEEEEEAGKGILLLLLLSLLLLFLLSSASIMFIKNSILWRVIPADFSAVAKKPSVLV